jgi:hypothetical protein
VGLLLVISDHVYGGTTSSAARRRFTILSVCGQLAALLERALPWGDRRPVTV